MSNPESNILIDERDGLAVITLNRAPQRNTLSIETIQDLIRAFAELQTRTELAVIVVKGLGEAFAAGADIKELLELTPTSAVAFSQLGALLFRSMHHSPQLIIAAIDGFCMGGGLDFALACDLRYCSSAAVFAHPGANIGIITGFGGTRRLPKAIGLRNAAQLFTTAERIDGLQAFQMGLAQAYTEQGSAYDLAIERGQHFASKGGKFITRLKTSVRISSDSRNPHRTRLLERYLAI